ncbi:MAG: ABC transporter ATP-binding protein [Planctomycetaceae bacterium]|jgi:putative ABC transport system ATP-binding protein|nr:ABC transporter ATP-binding protein [Planctomycetaceae bacterium]
MNRGLLETESLSRTYHPGTSSEVRALSDVSLAIPAGSYVVLDGPSGSGKTTLLSLLGALDRPTSGRVRFADRNLEDCSDVELARQRRRMGFVFQDFSLIPRLPTWENITYPQIPRGLSAAKRRQAADDVLSRLGLAAKADTPPEELSGGEQQRVAVARALIGDPEVIFADEPTSNLDRRAAAELAAILQEINAAGTTLVVSTHDTDLKESASLVFLLEDGRLRDDTA